MLLSPPHRKSANRWRQFKMKKQLLFGHLLTLITGGLIYISFRTDSLVMFKWFAALSVDTPIEYLRETTLTVKERFPDWFLFSLSDGLWVFSYISLTLSIWSNNINKRNLFWVFLVPFIAITSELGQLFNIVPGTFDAVDLTFYITGAISPFIFFTNNLFTFKTKTT